MNMLTEMEGRLSVVRRWSIVATIQQQSVAEHSFNVAMIADRLAQDVWKITDAGMLYEVQRHALLHDQWEGLTSDIPSVAKRFVDEEQVRKEYQQYFHDYEVPETVELIVKIADKMEAILFIRKEMALGNATMTSVLHDVVDILHDVVDKLEGTEYCNVLRTWISQMTHGTYTVNPMRHR